MTKDGKAGSRLASTLGRSSGTIMARNSSSGPVVTPIRLTPISEQLTSRVARSMSQVINSAAAMARRSRSSLVRRASAARICSSISAMVPTHSRIVPSAVSSSGWTGSMRNMKFPTAS